MAFVLTGCGNPSAPAALRPATTTAAPTTPPSLAVVQLTAAATSSPTDAPPPVTRPSSTAVVQSSATPLPLLVQATPAVASAPTSTNYAPAVVQPSVAATSAPVATPQPATPQEYTYRIINSYPHDPQAFTQGLIFHNGELYEGTGQNGQSSLRRVELATGRVLQRVALADEYFGEGIALVDDRIIQLTWKSQIGFVYDRGTFALRETFAYPGEGWGLTYDGQRLIMSDGTATLRFLDAATLVENGRVSVTDNGAPVIKLNELEWIDGQVYANIWQTDQIVRIDPASGVVTGRIDLTGLLSENDRLQPVDVLNGIAYDPATKRLFVTGKLWPRLFEIELVPR